MKNLLNQLHLNIAPKALIVGFQHPYHAVRHMAYRISGALIEHGYTPSIAVVGEDSFNNMNAISDPSVELIVFLGSPSLDITVNGQRIWNFVSENVTCLEIVLDSLPYDFRIQGFRDYLNDFPLKSNIHVASFEANIAQTLTDLTGKMVFHLPHGGHIVPKLKERPKYPDRLMFWGSVGAELGKNDATHDLLQTVSECNVWGLDPKRIEDLVENLRNAEDFYSYSALSQSLNISYKDLMRPEWLNALCSIDSAIKRYRRLLLVHSILDFPLDIYGKNWEQFLPQGKDVRIMSVVPDDNSAFSFVCQHYAGIVNIDPNWGNGTNERAITALTMGINVASNHNKMVADIPGFFPYSLNKQSISDACTKALTTRNPSPDLHSFTWTSVIGELLSKCR